MKIAIATDGNQVSSHFGHCEKFTVVTTENGQITGREFVANPGHQPGFLPNFLNDLGVNVIIAGGMGGSARQLFEDMGVEIITGAVGDIGQVAEDYSNGCLKSTDSVCTEHQHADTCGNH